MKRTIPARLSILLIMLLSSAVTFGETDVVKFANGDRLTGEVKSLERGRLRFKTDATDTISIEWDDVVYLKSNQNIQVETEKGERFLGRLAEPTESHQVIVETVSGPIELAMTSVVQMNPIEATRIDRLDGDITAGYNFAKASQVEQFHFAVNADYRTETRIFGFAADAIVSGSTDTESSQRQNLGLSYTRLLPRHWVAGALLQFSRNDELGLDLRTSVGVGGGRILLQTNSKKLQLTGGLQFSRENLAGDVSNEETVEAFGTLNWDWFRYDTPELDLSTKLQIIPNLTDTGRVRGEFDITLRWEIIDDLFWQLSFYDSYDSDPIVVDAEKNDYGVNTSLGWDF